MGSMDYFIGQNVVTPYGEATVTEIRSSDVVCRPKKWRLAGGSIPVFYLDPACVEAVDPSPKAMVLNAKAKKAEGMVFFKKGDHQKAKIQYMMALQALEKMPASIDDEVRAEVFELNVTCNNNIALCAYYTKQGQLCFTFAQNAFKLVDAIEAKANPGPSKVFDALCKIGTVTSLDDIRKLWKRKSVYFMGQACYLNKEYDKAQVYYEEALALLDSDESLAKESKTIETRMREAKKEKARFAKKEKSAYQKAFGKEDDSKSTTSDVSPKSSPAKSPRAQEGVVSTPTVEVATTRKAALPSPAHLKGPEPAVKSTAVNGAHQVDRGEDDDEYDDDDDEEDGEEEEWPAGPWPVVVSAAVVGLLAFAYLRGRR